MRLYRKLVLFALVAAVAPLAGVGVAVLRGAERALAARVREEQLGAARAAAAAIDADVAHVERSIGATASSFDPDRLSAPELHGLLTLVVSNASHATAAAIVDARGAVRSWVERGAPQEGPPGEGERAFLAAVRAPGREAGALAVYADPGRGPQLAVVRQVPGGRGQPWTIGARLGLDFARARLDAAAGSAGTAFLVDGKGAVLAASGRDAARAPDRSRVAALLGPEPRTAEIDGGDGPALAAWAPLAEGGGLGVLTRLPEADAHADAFRMRRTAVAASLAVLGVVLALAGLLARNLAGGLGRIEGAARALGAGDLSVRLPEGGADEIGEVSRTFNRMAEELGRARERLERWNEELQREAGARTRELQAAQAQLVEAQKLAAIGQLGAGVAHEINNPLTGILGHAQLLLEECPPGDPRREPLEKIEQLARRCRNVTLKLLRFSQQRAEPDFEALDLNRVVEDALALAEGQIRGAGIALEVALGDPAPRVRGDGGHLAQVVLNLLSNARTACLGREGCRITVATRTRGEEVEIAVADDGKGIAPDALPRIFEPFFTTKDLWSNVGLGLSVSYRIVAEHGGRIRVESEPGRGSTFTVALPAAPAAAV